MSDFDNDLIDLFGERPAKSTKSRHVLSGAQRQARYREASLKRLDARKTRFSHLSDITVARYMSDPDTPPEEAKELWLEFGRRRDWK